MTAKGLYRWTRDLHLYLGLYLCPFALVFAISTILLNHAWKPGAVTPRRTVFKEVAVPAELERTQGMDRVREARKILAQVGVSGEIDFIRAIPRENRIVIPVTKPGEETTISLNLQSREAIVDVRETGIGAALVYLHRSPGPHNVNVRGNWVYMRAWRWLADVTVYLVLFLSASGVYLWVFLPAERRLGIILTTAGCVSCGLLINAIVRG